LLFFREVELSSFLCSKVSYLYHRRLVKSLKTCSKRCQTFLSRLTGSLSHLAYNKALFYLIFCIVPTLCGGTIKKFSTANVQQRIKHLSFPRSAAECLLGQVPYGMSSLSAGAGLQPAPPGAGVTFNKPIMSTGINSKKPT
jgi:hypothetical protein